MIARHVALVSNDTAQKAWADTRLELWRKSLQVCELFFYQYVISWHICKQQSDVGLVCRVFEDSICHLVHGCDASTSCQHACNIQVFLGLGCSKGFGCCLSTKWQSLYARPQPLHSVWVQDAMLYLWDHEILPHNALCVPDDFTYCIQASWFIGVSPFRAFEEHGLSNFQFVQVLRHFAFWIDFDDKVDMSRSVIVRSGGVWPKEIFAIRFFCFERDLL